MTDGNLWEMDSSEGLVKGPKQFINRAIDWKIVILLQA